MGYISNGVGWYGRYPHGGPTDYSYTALFAQDFPRTGSEAEIRLTAYQNLVGATVDKTGKSGAAIAELNRMIGMARNAEQQFLVNHNFKNPGNDWNRLITDINKILSTQAAFERNVKLLQQFADPNDTNTKTYQDITVFFRQKLQSAVIDNLVIDINATGFEILQRAVIGALHEMENITETKMENGYIKTRRPDQNAKQTEILQAFVELFKVIQVVEGSEFLTKLTELFDLKDYIEAVRDSLINNTSNKNLPKLNYKGGDKGKGTLSELIYNEVARGLGNGGGNEHITWKTIEHTGGANYKPDRVLATFDISYNESVDNTKNNPLLKGKTKRAKGIATMEDLYAKMKDAEGDLVLISDKNYLINRGFITGRTVNGTHHLGGFKAQDVTSLNALEGLFNSLDITAFKIDQLIDYLANIGDNLIIPNIDPHILKVISTQIGNFLFDDLAFDESKIPGGVNIIHVFQLSGIYVPLSIILEGVKRGLDATMQADVSSYVEVEFNASSDVPNDWTYADDKTDKDFKDFRKTKQKNNKLEINFLRDFAAVIAANVQIPI